MKADGNYRGVDFVVGGRGKRRMQIKGGRKEEMEESKDEHRAKKRRDN
jgi:hypothetical protein